MSLFSEDMIVLQEERLINELESHLDEKIHDVQKTLVTGEGADLHRAQGFMQALEWFKDLPGEVVREAKMEDQTTEE